MRYSDKVKTNLSTYKEKYFPELENGVWKKNKLEYSHILPEEERNKNLLSTYRQDLYSFIKEQEVKLHSDFHHLNSSQAMCLNFFYPLIKERKLELITELLQLEDKDVNYEKVCFEKDGLEKEDKESPTSFDFYFETISGIKIYFEIKYSENEFGKAKADESHLAKFSKCYSKHLEPLNPKYHSAETFLDNYQILRNLIHIKDDSVVVFIYPEGNSEIKNRAENAKKEMLINSYKNNFYPLSWEHILRSINSKVINNQKIQEQLTNFEEKYLP